MKHYSKPLIDVIDLFSQDKISADYNGEDIYGNLLSSNYAGPENVGW